MPPSLWCFMRQVPGLATVNLGVLKAVLTQQAVLQPRPTGVFTLFPTVFSGHYKGFPSLLLIQGRAKDGKDIDQRGAAQFYNAVQLPVGLVRNYRSHYRFPAWLLNSLFITKGTTKLSCPQRRKPKPVDSPGGDPSGSSANPSHLFLSCAPKCSND